MHHLYPHISHGNNNDDADSGNGTDSDTSSDDGTLYIDFSDVQKKDPREAEQLIYFQKRYFTRKWRRWTAKTVRKSRRFVKRRKGSGGSKARHFIA